MEAGGIVLAERSPSRVNAEHGHIYIADAESGQYFFQGLFRCIPVDIGYRVAHFVIARSFFQQGADAGCCQLGEYIDIGNRKFYVSVDGAFLVIVINHMVDGAQSGFVFRAPSLGPVKEVAGDLYFEVKTFLELHIAACREKAVVGFHFTAICLFFYVSQTFI